MNFMKYLHAYYVFYKYKFYVPRIKIYTWISGEPLLALTGNQLEIDINTQSFPAYPITLLQFSLS